MGFELLSDGALNRWIRDAIGQPITVSAALTSVGRASTVLVPLAWPIGLGIVARTNRVWAGVLFILAVGVLTFHVSVTASFVALRVGVAGFVMAYHFPRSTQIGLGLTFVTFAVAAPIIAASLPSLNALREMGLDIGGSAAHRLKIWRFG